MFKKSLRKFLRPVWRYLGVDSRVRLRRQKVELQRDIRHLKRHMNGMLIAHRHMLERIESNLEFATIDESRMKQSQKFHRIQEVVSLLSPMGVSGGQYKRFGRDCDGGYVMLDEISPETIDAAYSFGIADDVSWDEAIAVLGIDVYMYDHTIEQLPKNHSRFHYFKEGVAGRSEESGLRRLGEFVLRNGHGSSQKLILKMDIEGCEWDVLDDASSEEVGKFVQIVIEYHDLKPDATDDDWSKMISVLNKLNQTHQCIHVHANSFCSINCLGDLVLPSVLEVTYIRRMDHLDRLVQNTRTFPTDLDKPTFPWLPDVELGAFSAGVKN